MIMDIEAQELEEGDNLVITTKIKKVVRGEVNMTITFVDGTFVIVPRDQTIIVSTNEIRRPE